MVDAFESENRRFENLRRLNEQQLRNSSRQAAQYYEQSLRSGNFNVGDARSLMRSSITPANNPVFSTAAAVSQSRSRSIPVNDLLERIRKLQPVVTERTAAMRRATTVSQNNARIVERRKQIEEIEKRNAELLQIETSTDETDLVGNRNPYEYLRPRFEEWGLGELFNNLLDDFAKVNEGQEDIVLGIARASEPYRRRFLGNEERKRRGLSTLDEATYIANEQAYNRAAQAFGFDSGDLLVDPQGKRIDKQNAFAFFIGRDVSPVELTSRLRAADDWTKNVNPQAKEALQRFYGVQDKDLMKFALNPEGGQMQLERIAATARVGSEALAQGFDILGATTSGVRDDRLSRGFLEDLATRSTEDLRTLTPEQRTAEMARAELTARESVGRAAEQRLGIERLADISAEDITSQEQVEAQFSEITGLSSGTGAAGRRARTRIASLRSQERARFGGASGGANIFGIDESGSF